MATRRVLELLEKKKKLMSMLPHLYSFKWYDWAWEFFNNKTDRVQLLCAANQISKSSTQIRKCIYWATEKEEWPLAWPDDPVPVIFWYFYPSLEVATSEFEHKWVREFMPRDEMKFDPKYGWKAEYDSDKKIKQVRFNSGVTLMFKTYSKRAQVLQSATVHAIFCDEELPAPLFDELFFRTNAVNGFFHMVFTATMGQAVWWRAMERVGHKDESFKDAWKKTVSMYDCMKYKDGSPAKWNEERIKKVKGNCSNQNEVLKRVYGRFVMDTGLVYPHFDPKKHYAYVQDKVYWRNWGVYSGVDIGSGGAKGHPAGIAMVYVSDKRDECVVECWRGDGIETTCGDIFEKWQEMKRGRRVVSSVYDFASKDFGTIAQRLGASFQTAKKLHQQGELMFNTLLKAGVLKIYADDEGLKLGDELSRLGRKPGSLKGYVGADDLIDAVRYAVMSVPWDMDFLNSLAQGEKKVQNYRGKGRMSDVDRMRREAYGNTRKQEEWEYKNEVAFWNNQYGS